MKAHALALTTLALSGALALPSPVRAEEMQVSGSQVLTVIETHMIPSADNPARVFGVEKVVGATTAPGWFDSMQATYVESFLNNLQLGSSEARGTGLWTNRDGTMTSSYVGKAAFAMDEKANAPKGNYEGTWEITGGTGRFANVHGQGIYKGEFNGPNSMNQWSGTVTGAGK